MLEDIQRLNEDNEEDEVIVPEVIEEIPRQQDKPIVKRDEASLIALREARIRRLEIARWAEEKGIIKGVPRKEELEKIWIKLKNGSTLKRALKNVCSYTTWCQWRKEYPFIAAMEEQSRFEYAQKLQDEMRKIADQPDRTRMGETARDRLMVEIRQKELERIDKLTENRMEKSYGNVVPIQINVSYGKENDPENA